METNDDVFYYIDTHGFKFPVYFKKSNKYSKNIYFKLINNKVYLYYYKHIKIEKVINSLTIYINKLIDKKMIKLEEYSLDSNNKMILKSDIEYLYIFGEKYRVNIDETINIFGKKISVNNVTKDNLLYFYKSISNLFYKNLYEEFLKFKEIMNINKDLTFSLRVMKTRYGTNSRKTSKITLSYSLIPYSLKIIDSVIVHELAHCYYFDHSKNFYNIVYKYYPEYDYYQRKLKKGEYF